MNIFVEYERTVAEAVQALMSRGALPAGLDTARIVVEPPRDPRHGDLATNAAMVLAKDAGLKPRDLADLLATELRAARGVRQVDVAGPGFINLTLNAQVFDDVLRSCLLAERQFGSSARGLHAPVNVEYVSANPTGPMHIGHCRGAAYGDALANLLAFIGHPVTREYYINDAGTQVDVLARSAFLRYREALGEDIGAIPEGLYPGAYLKPVGDRLAARHGDALLSMAEVTWLPIVRQEAVDAMMEMIRDDLDALGIRHDVFFSERSLTEPEDRIAETIEALRARDLVYEGRLAPPKGQAIEDWEDREQTLFRSTAFGDDVDRPLLKSDGTYAYFAPDIAYHRIKFLRGTPHLINVFGADHGGYVKRLKAAVAAVTDGKGRVDIELCQLVKLLRDGVEVKMSKRSGNFVTLREVVDEVGRDAVRFMMIYRKNDAPLDFDLAKVVEQSKDNPVFYVQYAHARTHSVQRQVLLAFPDMELTASALAAADLARLSDESERTVVSLIAQYPRLITQAAENREPHRLAFYLYELASAFHSLWNRGKEDQDLRFVNNADRESTMARLALVFAVRVVIGSGLTVLGVSAPEEMR
jgi:arginyl-tRNA synthetase